MNEVGDTIRCGFINIKRKRFSIEEIRAEDLYPFGGLFYKKESRKRYVYFLRSECGLYKIKTPNTSIGYKFKIARNILIEKKVKNTK
jgi:hypothetical protein